MRKIRWNLLMFGFTLVLLAGILTMPGEAGNGSDNRKLMPPQSNAHGHSAGEWSARWWQWCYSLPVDHHPLTDTADCSAGQTGNVWFLGVTFTTIDENPEDPIVEGIATRTCKIPTGTTLFFPLLNVEASTLEGNGEAEQDLRDFAVFNGDHIVPESLFCTVDGVAATDLIDYRTESPLFSYGPLPENNLLQAFGLDAPAGSTSAAVGDGVYVMVNPFPKASTRCTSEAPRFTRRPRMDSISSSTWTSPTTSPLESDACGKPR